MAGPRHVSDEKPVDAAAASAPPRGLMDRFIDGIELLAAIFVGLVAADTFISVLLRKFFSTSIPDSYDFGRLLLGILIFWGIAATSYRGTHITVDLVWANVGPRQQRVYRLAVAVVPRVIALTPPLLRVWPRAGRSVVFTAGGRATTTS